MAMMGFDAAGVGEGVAEGAGVGGVPGSVFGEAGVGFAVALGRGTFATGAGEIRGVRIG